MVSDIAILGIGNKAFFGPFFLRQPNAAICLKCFAEFVHIKKIPAIISFIKLHFFLFNRHFHFHFNRLGLVLSFSVRYNTDKYRNASECKAAASIAEEGRNRMEHKVVQFHDYMQNDVEIRILVDEIIGYHPPHAHDFIEIAYIDSGTGYHTVNGVREKIYPGDLYIFNAHNVVHSFDSGEGGPLRVYNCLFQPPSIDRSLRDCKNFVDVTYHYLFHSFYSKHDSRCYIKLTGLKYSQIEQIFYECEQEATVKENGYLQILKANLMRLLIQIFRLYKKDMTQPQNLSVYNQLIVENATTYLKKHYNENISCEWLAKQAYLSVNYFRCIFKRVTGMTMIQMLQNIRINIACELLETTCLPVSEIAGRVGYGDVKFFYQIFKKVRHQTPGNYRKMNSVESPPK